MTAFVTYDYIPSAASYNTDLGVGVHPDKEILRLMAHKERIEVVADRPIFSWRSVIQCGYQNNSQHHAWNAAVPTASVYSDGQTVFTQTNRTDVGVRPGGELNYSNASTGGVTQTGRPAVVLWSPRFKFNSALPSDRLSMTQRCRIYLAYTETDGGPEYGHQITVRAPAEPNNLSSLTTVLLYSPTAVRVPDVAPGGSATADYTYQLRADGPFRATVSYTISTPDGRDGKIGDGTLRLRFVSGHPESGFADLSGGTAYVLTGGAGTHPINTRLEIHAPTNARLGSYRTNLRVNVAYQ